MHIKSLLQLDHQVDISSISQRLPRSVTLGNQPVWHHYDVLLVPRAPWLPRFWKINLTSLDNMQISVVLHISFSILRRLPRIKLFFLRIYIKLKWRQSSEWWNHVWITNITRFHPKRDHIHPNGQVFIVVQDVYDNFTHQKVTKHLMSILDFSIRPFFT